MPKKKKKRQNEQNLGVEELGGRQYLYSWGPKLIWQVAWLWGIGSTARVAESEWNTNRIGGLHPFSLSTQKVQGWKPETLNCWEKPLLPLCLVSPFCHMIHVYLFQLLGYPATCSLETAIPLGLWLERRWTSVKGYEDVMRQFNKESKRNNLKMIGLEQTSVSSLGSGDPSYSPST